MVYMHFPQHLTEEEEMLQRKYAKLKKKKKALAALRAPKPEPKEPTDDPLKRTKEAAADAMAHAKKLLKSGAIKVEAEKKETQRFKRTKRSKDQDRGSVSFQPFSEGQDDDDRNEESDSGASRPKMKRLYDSFVSSRDPSEPPVPDRRFDREREDRREREREREPPKKGKTIYVYGIGISEDLLRTAFSNLGNIVNITMESDKNVGFVTFDKMETADTAISEVNGGMVSGVQLRVSMARRQPTFEVNDDASKASWSSIAANLSQKGTHKDGRTLVAYTEDDDIF